MTKKNSIIELALSTEMMFPVPGMNRERELSAIVSALTHVVTGEVPSGDHTFSQPHQYHLLHHQQQQQLHSGAIEPVTQNMSSPSSTSSPSLPSSSSSSSTYVASSSLKRRREDDRSSPAISKHQFISYLLSFFKKLINGFGICLENQQIFEIHIFLL